MDKGPRFLSKGARSRLSTGQQRMGCSVLREMDEHTVPASARICLRSLCPPQGRIYIVGIIYGAAIFIQVREIVPQHQALWPAHQSRVSSNGTKTYPII